MTIQTAINRARALRDTEISDEQLRDWLDSYDEGLWDRVLSKYYDGTPVHFPYSGEEDWRQLDLLLGDKYGEEIYPIYLTMKIDLHHGDYDRYNNDAILFNETDKAMRMDVSRERAWKPPRPDGWPEERPWDGRINLKF